jgi:tRNA(fMet)-specific endonuclease VapC
MSDAVIDTDVVSFLFKRDTRADAYKPHLVGRRLVVSFMTVAELEAWVLIRNWGETNKARMREHLRNFVTYPFERSLCLKWAEVTAVARANGRPIGCADAWIAATAMLHEIPLVTHNRNDFAGVSGLTLISEAS